MHFNRYDDPYQSTPNNNVLEMSESGEFRGIRSRLSFGVAASPCQLLLWHYFTSSILAAS